jgi:Tubulin/FtsZ family, GTPase domain
VGTYEAERTPSERNSAPGTGEAGETGWESHLRLGQDVRFVLAAVGGGAIRVGREIARQHIRHLETVAINCDPKVQGFDEYDCRVYLGPDSGTETDTGGSPFVGGLLARAAEPALQRIFHGATFVIVIGSLGGGAGSGALPYVLEVASRNAEVVSAFVIKPFRCEGDRRALADRAIGRLHFVESFVEKRERGLATLQTLDNESLVPTQGQIAFSRISQHWASVIEEHIERSFLAPAEALIEAAQLSQAALLAPMNRIPAAELPALELVPPGAGPHPMPELPPALPAVRGSGPEVELTFEVDSQARPPAAQ